jgi:hypothetical protein
LHRFLPLCQQYHFAYAFSINAFSEKSLLALYGEGLKSCSADMFRPCFQALNKDVWFEQ